MSRVLIKNGQLVNRGSIQSVDVLIVNGRIERIDPQISDANAKELVADGKLVLPGVIDDQVHFREPGLTYKATIFSESRAAVAGGVTSFMEMPNTSPPATTQALLADKYEIGARTSAANYSFFMGAANDNIEEVLRTSSRDVCGVKAFMGSSTGNMLVDNAQTLEALFSRCPMLIATHCEDEPTVRHRLALYRERFGDDIPAHYHAEIRDVDACLRSSSFAAGLAKKYGTRLHILHITTAEETELFTNAIPLKEKLITSEACVHHLWYEAHDYGRLGHQIKCNPAIKEVHHREAIWAALLDDRIDVIATDHAPHTWSEKQQPYTSAPSGLPLIQHGLQMMLQWHHKGRISLERIVEKMCHAPADLFAIEDRGYADEGKWADLVIVDPNATQLIEKSDLLYHCGWSTLEGETMKGRVVSTLINGQLAWHEGQLMATDAGQRLLFNR